MGQDSQEEGEGFTRATRIGGQKRASGFSKGRPVEKILWRCIDKPVRATICEAERFPPCHGGTTHPGGLYPTRLSDIGCSFHHFSRNPKRKMKGAAR